MKTVGNNYGIIVYCPLFFLVEDIQTAKVL